MAKKKSWRDDMAGRIKKLADWLKAHEGHGEITRETTEDGFFVKLRCPCGKRHEANAADDRWRIAIEAGRRPDRA
jgi:hypothetical protein